MTICYSPNRAFCEIDGVAFAVGMRHAQQNKQPHGDLARQLTVYLHAADALHHGAMQGLYHTG
ncbi:MAG TPA: hypothetical protein VKG65_10520 [Terriglobales bacterium]|nr:hypothetical protein [Terriglobales bacterium]